MELNSYIESLTVRMLIIYLLLIFCTNSYSFRFCVCRINQYSNQFGEETDGYI